MSSVQVAPHEFRPLARRDVIRVRFGKEETARCLHCFAPASRHPVVNWSKARSLGDYSKPEAAS